MAGIEATEYIPAHKGDINCHEIGCDGQLVKISTINPVAKIDLMKCNKCKKTYYVRGK